MNDKQSREEESPEKGLEKGLEKGYANRHAEITEPGQVRRQDIPPEIDGDPDEIEREADRRRSEGVERGYANRHAEVAGGLPGPPPRPAPFTAPRTTAVPEGGYEPGYPKVYFSVYDRVPPIVVKEPHEEAGVDKANFMTIPPEEVSTELTDAKMRAEYRVGNRAAEYPPKSEQDKPGGHSAWTPPQRTEPDPQHGDPGAKHRLNQGDEPKRPGQGSKPK